MLKTEKELCFDELKQLIEKTTERSNVEEGVKTLMKRWEANKKWMLPFFGEDGRIELETDRDFNEELDSQYLRDKLDNTMTKILANDKTKISPKFQILSNFYTNIYNFISVKLLDNFTIREILLNSLERENCLPDISINGKYYNKGTKISKILLSYIDRQYSRIKGRDENNNILFINEDTLPILKDFVSIVYSLLCSEKLPSKKIKIALSINPLDLLMVSAHTTGWSSCHRFYDKSYATGGIAYMCDKTTAVAYSYWDKKPFNEFISSRNQYLSTDIELPVKTWRQMVFFSPEDLAAIHSREYPMNDLFNAKKARRLSAKILSEYGKCDYRWRKEALDSNSSIDNFNDEEERENCYYGSNGCNIKKLGFWSYYDHPTTIIRMNSKTTKRIGVTIAKAEIPCVVCGRPRKKKNHESAQHLICSYCSFNKKCCICEEPLLRDTAIFEANEYYCKKCFENSFKNCYKCGRFIKKEMCLEITADTHICFNCYKTDGIDFCDICEKFIVESPYNWRVQSIITGEVKKYCLECVSGVATYCSACSKYILNEETENYVDYSGRLKKYCIKCILKRPICSECGTRYNQPIYSFPDGLCKICHDKRRNS